jgi:hypothetical protein
MKQGRYRHYGCLGNLSDIGLTLVIAVPLWSIYLWSSHWLVSAAFFGTVDLALDPWRNYCIAFLCNIGVCLVQSDAPLLSLLTLCLPISNGTSPDERQIRLLRVFVQPRRHQIGSRDCCYALQWPFSPLLTCAATGRVSCAWPWPRQPGADRTLWCWLTSARSLDSSSRCTYID